MSGTHSVETGLLEETYSPVFIVIVGLCSEKTGVVMDAGAPKILFSAVDSKAVNTVNRDRTDASLKGFLIQFALLVGDAELHTAKLRCIGAPGFHASEVPFRRHMSGLTTVKQNRQGNIQKGLAVLGNLRPDPGIHGLNFFIFHRGIDPDSCSLFIESCHRHPDRIRHNRNEPFLTKINVPENAGSRIVTGGQIHRVCHHKNLIFFSGNQIVCEICVEMLVGIFVFRRRTAVHIDHGSREHTAKLEKNPSFALLRKLKLLIIVVNAAVQKAHPALVHAVFLLLFPDQGIVGKLHREGVLRHYGEQLKCVSVLPEFPSFIP